ncbi:hypothetical protein SDD27957_08160 [Streptococcus dysgalactiae subsp. dysgalactiae ATCC 27957]|nr:hypothetical protein SDD27957_08160 [Streptococcus dysgalactiae subsp. dysgalactiae ATCC 27957]
MGRYLVMGQLQYFSKIIHESSTNKNLQSIALITTLEIFQYIQLLSDYNLILRKNVIKAKH